MGNHNPEGVRTVAWSELTQKPKRIITLQPKDSRWPQWAEDRLTFPHNLLTPSRRLEIPMQRGIPIAREKNPAVVDVTGRVMQCVT